MEVKKVCVVIFFLAVSGRLFCQNNNVANRWVYSPILDFNLSLINKHHNFKDEKIPLRRDNSYSVGLQFLKYYPNNSHFYNLSAKYLRRNVVVDLLPSIFINENSVQIDALYNFYFTKKRPLNVEISKYYLGFGLSYSYLINGNFDYFNNLTINNSNVLSKHRIEGLLNIGILEDVFNVSKKSSISKLNLMIRFPLLSLSNSYNTNFLALDQEIENFQNSSSNKLGIELQYYYLIDTKTRKFNNNYLLLDTTWKEISNPVKNIIPPLNNNKLPTKNNFGNFFAEVQLYNFGDSIYIENTGSNMYIENKILNSISFGYSFNFFGNYKKDYTPGTEGIGRENKGTNWRRNIFISTGYKNLLIKASQQNNNSNTFASFGILRSGIKLKNIKNRVDCIIGASYYLLFNGTSYYNHIETNPPALLNSGYFVGFGFNNYIIKVEYECFDFKINSNEGYFSFSFNLGI